VLVVDNLLQLLEVHLEDLECLLLVERRVVQADVDAGLECLVQGPDPVGREEQDAAVVFEDAEKHWNG
jgi:hypothetical protein